MGGVFKYIPELKFGLWNAWIFMIWQFVLPLLISTFLHKNNISSRLSASAPAKNGRLLDISTMVLTVISILYSVFLPLRLKTIWFIPGLIIFAIALLIIFLTVFALRHAESGRPFTSGMYLYSRHPFYLSMGLMYIGITMMSASWVFLILAILFIAQLFIAGPIEERSCLKIYGREYQEYLARTPRWIGLPKQITH